MDEIEQVAGNAPETESLDTGSTSNTDTQTDPATGQPIEIDNLDRYRYQGRELKEWIRMRKFRLNRFAQQGSTV